MRMTDQRTPDAVTQPGPGRQGGHVLQRTCQPAPKPRADFLKITGKTPPDAPLGLTTLNTGDVGYPAVLTVETPAKKPDAKPSWTLSETEANILADIPSNYTATGSSTDKLKPD